MKKVTLFAVMTALVFTACNNDENLLIGKTNYSITASMETLIPQTRTGFDENGSLYWNVGDDIAVWGTNKNFTEYTLKSGAGTTSATFGASSQIGKVTTYALHPYSAHKYENEELIFNLPATYVYGETEKGNEYGVAPMIAQFEEGVTDYYFEHLGGVFCFTINNLPASATYFKFETDEQITGDYFVTENEDGKLEIALPDEQTVSETSYSVTVNFSSEESSTNKRFFIPVPVGTYEGFKISVGTSEKELWSYTSVASNEIARKTLLAMPEVTLDPTIDAIVVTEVDTFDELKAAFANGGSIKLAADIELTESLSSTKDVTLDLAGKSITPSSSFATDALIVAKYGATLTINDSEGNGSLNANDNAKVYAAVKLTEKGDVAEEEQVAKLVVNGGTLSGTYYGISGNGYRPGTVVEIKGGTITSTAVDGLGIYHPQDGTITIENGIISGAMSAIEMRAGTLNIKGGNFTATSSEFSSQSNGSGNTISGAAVAVSKYNAESDLTVTIDGGTFKGIYALYEEYLETEPMLGKLSIDVNDGTFNGLVYSENCSVAFESISVNATMSKTMSLNDETFDGGNGTLNVDLSATSGSVAKAFSVTGGTIKNLTIDCGNIKNSDGNSSRGIFIENATGNVILDNVTIRGVGYTMNTGSDIADELKLSVSNSTLIGWTSYAKFASAEFTNCYFGIGTNYGNGSISNGNLKPHVTTVLEGCTFEKGFGLDFSELVDGATVTFKKCKVKLSETETIDLSGTDTENIVWDTYSSSKVTIE